VSVPAHVQRLHRQPDRFDPNHRNSLRNTAPHCRAAVTGHCTVINVLPRRTSTRLSSLPPDAQGIVTGTNGGARTGTGNLPASDASKTASARSACITQRRNRFAFSPLESATEASDTPGFRHAATDSALN
jgi:hypothetical protein